MSAALRAQTARLFYAIAFDGRSANEVLLELRQQISDRHEQGFVQECLFGTARHFEKLDWMLNQLLSKSFKKKDNDLRCLLLTALYQLFYLDKPSHAVVSESVNATRQLDKDWASKLVNGVLRNAQRQGKELMSSDQQPLNVQHELPQWLFKRLRGAWPRQLGAIAEAAATKAPLVLRINQSHPEAAHYSDHLSTANIEFETHKTVESAIRLKQAVPVSQIPLFDEGLFSVQDLSAQLAAWILPLTSSNKVLDACAAPGGKTAHLLERHQLNLTAVDKDPRRAEKIHQNLQRLSLECEVIAADAGQLEESAFDGILLDAPCSATGVIRRQPDIKLHRQNSDIAQVVNEQKQLLESLWAKVKQGGHLLYATCSILPQENAEQIKGFLDRHPDAKLEPLATDIMALGIDTRFGLQILPQNWHDGFFYALLKKA
ncbi:16S rRNA (cytosine(967)-C(5))-methyltransferase RsmB [Pleionea sp. CnH1-48]|uniref:16S rRNA (cytosine(967)-C(5))-methyltransferase RsmB n=1 Tax=Pleionea sp. CnH1-48 TaxID=2954494 RepID=UPI002096DB27|nr:16S rRNA (cytosine(967)-C(5))-methyltransferase RsmB [Pleionea sp. CnH1-48]MCO7226571.1 16S rRNA (cytosine(967)-C(5))-methyltransferase RsmB [Pleionea sp. CnH1-48]